MYRGAQVFCSMTMHAAQYCFLLPSVLFFLLSRGAGLLFNDDALGPILVFFANFLFSKRKWKVLTNPALWLTIKDCLIDGGLGVRGSAGYARVVDKV